MGTLPPHPEAPVVGRPPAAPPAAWYTEPGGVRERYRTGSEWGRYIADELDDAEDAQRFISPTTPPASKVPVPVPAAPPSPGSVGRFARRRPVLSVRRRGLTAVLGVAASSLIVAVL